jgi:hypothetical protein
MQNNEPRQTMREQEALKSTTLGSGYSEMGGDAKLIRADSYVN